METKLKLWQAILIGCDRRAQAFGKKFVTHPNGEICSCVYGAAEEAIIGVPVTTEFAFSTHYPFLLNHYDCPECGERTMMLCMLSVHLNDLHKWPREKIALEFVKKIEEEQADAPKT